MLSFKELLRLESRGGSTFDTVIFIAAFGQLPEFADAAKNICSRRPAAASFLEYFLPPPAGILCRCQRRDTSNLLFTNETDKLGFHEKAETSSMFTNRIHFFRENLK